MNLANLEAEAAIREEYTGTLSDNGVQAEGVKIDGVPVLGNLRIQEEPTDLVVGGWHEDVKGVFYSLKSEFPNGYPKRFSSVLECNIGGETQLRQIIDIQGDKDNRAQLAIGFGAKTNRK